LTSFSFLRQMLQDVRHQKMRTLLTLFGITWGTVSVALLVSFGEALEKRIRKNQRGLGENIVVAPYATALASMVDPQAAARNFDRLVKLSDQVGGRERETSLAA
jgi:hypothetical protein